MDLDRLIEESWRRTCAAICEAWASGREAGWARFELPAPTPQGKRVTFGGAQLVNVRSVGDRIRLGTGEWGTVESLYPFTVRLDGKVEAVRAMTFAGGGGSSGGSTTHAVGGNGGCGGSLTRLPDLGTGEWANGGCSGDFSNRGPSISVSQEQFAADTRNALAHLKRIVERGAPAPASPDVMCCGGTAVRAECPFHKP